MRVALSVFFLFLCLQASYAGDNLDKVAKDLIAAQSELQDLAIDLPFSRVNPDWRERVRERYKEGLSTLGQVIAAVQRNQVSDAVKQLERSLAIFREAGLLLPFSETEPTKADEIISRYLKAEDLLSSSLSALTGGPIIKPTTPLWRFDKKVWRALEGYRNVVDASIECQRTSLPNTRNWRLPTMVELARAYPYIRDPRDNTAFGDKAQFWREVWTCNSNASASHHYVVDFQTKETLLAPASSLFVAVCIGEE